MKGQLPSGTQHFNCQPNEMIIHTQQQPKNCLSVFVHFVGLTLKGLASRQRMQHDVQTNSFYYHKLKPGMFNRKIIMNGKHIAVFMRILDEAWKDLS